jgi:hypothetical protein
VAVVTAEELVGAVVLVTAEELVGVEVAEYPTPHQ